jgi:predicted nucleic acid-binding protein
MARYMIDPPALLYMVDIGPRVAPGHQLAASNSIRSEALELLLHDVRAGKRTEAAALQAHERVTEIKIRLLGDRVSRRTAWQIARQHDWDTFRDAEYLAITRLQADALVTVDRASRCSSGRCGGRFHRRPAHQGMTVVRRKSRVAIGRGPRRLRHGDGNHVRRSA